MIGWTADLLRLAWGLFYWNLRKSVFRVRGGRGGCPCQCPSDSGRAMETGCEASLGWHRPARFQRVCPLLKRDAAGQLKCSVNTADVRPFWGRAFLLCGGTIAGLYLAGTLAVFVFFRTVGFPVGYLTVAWPPHWARFKYAKSEYFAAKARQALADKNVGDALLSLSLAYQYNPDNYAAGLALAQMYQAGQPGMSDQIYARLMRSHPAQRLATLKLWYQAVLARGDFRNVALLGREAIKLDAGGAQA